MFCETEDLETIFLKYREGLSAESLSLLLFVPCPSIRPHARNDYCPGEDTVMQKFPFNTKRQISSYTK